MTIYFLNTVRFSCTWTSSCLSLREHTKGHAPMPFCSSCARLPNAIHPFAFLAWQVVPVGLVSCVWLSQLPVSLLLQLAFSPLYLAVCLSLLSLSAQLVPCLLPLSLFIVCFLFSAQCLYFPLTVVTFFSFALLYTGNHIYWEPLGQPDIPACLYDR